MDEKILLGIIGKSGCGKSYVGKKLAGVLGFVHHKIGDEWRAMGETNENFRQIYDSGNAMPSGVYKDLVTKYSNNLLSDKACQGIVIDDLFFEYGQVTTRIWQHYAKKLKIVCIYMDVAEEIIIANREARIAECIAQGITPKTVDTCPEAIERRNQINLDRSKIVEYILKHPKRFTLIEKKFSSLQSRDDDTTTLIRRVVSEVCPTC
ncbi:MAG: AAA family ATPase [Pseudomonadales bacterium]|nr:AAA family ATPase [Pseudomonadales bacterium]